MAAVYSTSPFPAARFPGPWLWAAPALAFFLFLAAAAGLLRVYDDTEREQAHSQLIQDALWLEQNINFVFERHAAVLATLSWHGQDNSAFDHQTDVLISNHEGLRQMAWYDTGHRLRHVYPGHGQSMALTEERVRASQRLAAMLGQTRFGAPVSEDDEDWSVAMHVPVFQAGKLTGYASAVYSLRRILAETIPWWLAARYDLQIADTSGRIQVSRSRLQNARLANENYPIALDPPGYGLSLILTPYRQVPPWSARLLPVALVLLTILTLLSLWALWRNALKRHAIEADLRKEHAFRKAMEDSLQTGMRALDNEGRITYVNPAFCRMVGYPAEMLIGSHAPQPYWPEDQRTAIAEAFSRLRRGDTAPEMGVEMQLQRQNGERFDALLFETPLIGPTGEQVGWMGSLLDITERKRARQLVRQQEERLAATARLVTMGEMASSLAHELNQPLAAIAGYTSGCVHMLAAPAPDLPALRGILEKTAAQATRAGRIIRSIYDFARRAELKPEPCALTAALDETLDLAEVEAQRKAIHIVRDCAPDLPVIIADRVLLTQALLNLIRNAIEATEHSRSPHGGRAEIRVCSACHADHILITVTDFGPGIDEATAARLYEPFFTTKDEGLGMGLNICRSVLEAHHGRLDFTRNCAGGTTFTIRLPRARLRERYCLSGR